VKRHQINLFLERMIDAINEINKSSNFFTWLVGIARLFRVDESMVS